MKEHFSNVKESIELFSRHSTHDSATAMFYSKLSALERSLQEVEKKTHASRILQEQEEKQEEQKVADALRYSTNVFNVERDSIRDGEPAGFNNSYLVSQDISRIDATSRSYTNLTRSALDDEDVINFLVQQRDVLDVTRDSFVQNDDDNHRKTSTVSSN